MSLDDISVLIGRLLIAIVVIGAVFVGVHAFAPGWFDNIMNKTMNSLGAGQSAVSNLAPKATTP